MADPKIESRVRELRAGWKGMGKIERGDRLWQLIFSGCSRRGLARSLRQSETSIRRHMELADLPAAGRDMIDQGFSAKRILAKKARSDRTIRRRQRIAKDRETGVLSDELADMILEFCRAEDGVPEYAIRDVDLPLLLGDVETHLSWFDARGCRFPPVAKKLGTKILFEKTRPVQIPDEFFEAHRAKWLATVIWTRAREAPIWERALEKAKRRARELN